MHTPFPSHSLSLSLHVSRPPTLIVSLSTSLHLSFPPSFLLSFWDNEQCVCVTSWCCDRTQRTESSEALWVICCELQTAPGLPVPSHTDTHTSNSHHHHHPHVVRHCLSSNMYVWVRKREWTRHLPLLGCINSGKVGSWWPRCERQATVLLNSLI